MLKTLAKRNTQIIYETVAGNQQVLGEIINKDFYPTNSPYMLNTDDLRYIIKEINKIK